MGLLRFILAASVMIHHGGRLGELKLFAADVAVYMFFIISGFYMALTLESHYLGRPGGINRFYANRALRLFPGYWVCVLGAVLLFHLNAPLFAQAYLKAAPALGSGPDFLFALSMDAANLVIVGSDLLRSFVPGNVFHSRYQLIPPAWSLAVELGFYALAPFIVVSTRRPIVLWTLLALCFLLSWGVGALLPSEDRWRWFDILPGSMAFFVMGVAAYRLTRSAVKEARLATTGRYVFAALTATLVVMLIFAGRIPPFYPADAGDFRIAVDARSVAFMPFYVTVAALVPFLFYATEKSGMDRFLGDLSYPLYVVHWPVLYFVLPVINQWAQKFGHVVPQGAQGLVCIAFAVALYILVDRTLLVLRARVRRPASPAPGS